MYSQRYFVKYPKGFNYEMQTLFLILKRIYHDLLLPYYLIFFLKETTEQCLPINRLNVYTSDSSL